MTSLIRILYAIVICSACSTIPSPATSVAAITADVPASCTTAAIPNDGLDDRAAIDAACALQRCAHLTAGTYDIVTPSFVPPARRIYAMIVSDGCSIQGAGKESTTLRFTGSGGHQDWEGIRMTGDRPTLDDVRLDTSGITDTNEQTHAIKVLGPTRSPRIRGIDCSHPMNPVEHKGSCAQFVGYNDGRLIVNMRVEDSVFEADRSGIDVHSGVHGGRILGNTFSAVGNTDMDFEGSGNTSDIEIAYNTMTMSPGPHGVGSLQLQRVKRVDVHDNEFHGRGIDVFQSTDVRIYHNIIRLTQPTGTPVIAVTKDSARVSVFRNLIERTAEAGAGSVIRAVPHGTGTPGYIDVTRNWITQGASGSVIETVGVVGLRVLDNVVTYAGPPAVAWGVLANGGGSNAVPGVRTTGIEIVGNTWVGPLRGIIGLSGSYAGSGSVTSRRNSVDGASSGIVCGNFSVAGRVLGPVTSIGDQAPEPVCGPAGFVRSLLPGRPGPVDLELERIDPSGEPQ